jgi:hypothetical protein
MPIDIFNAAKEVANAVKKYNDVPLMNQVFDLQQALLDLQKENIELKRQLEEMRVKLEIRQSIKKRGEYFYHDGDEEPLCPKCWQKDDKPVYLSAQKISETYGKYRQCIVCMGLFIEKEPTRTNGQVRPVSEWG